MTTQLLQPVHAWFHQQGWTPLPFQQQAWEAQLAGRSGLIQVPTGSGKTYAAVMGAMAAMLAEPQPPKGLRLLYITPLRALSRDLELALLEPIIAMGWPITVGTRNGDTSAAARTKQLKQPPNILITTPESLALLQANKRSEALVEGLQTVVLDEWHELLGSKRGIQAELALSWLRQQRPALQSWVISATIGNVDQAARHGAVGAEGVRLGFLDTTHHRTCDFHCLFVGFGLHRIGAIVAGAALDGGDFGVGDQVQEITRFHAEVLHPLMTGDVIGHHLTVIVTEEYSNHRFRIVAGRKPTALMSSKYLNVDVRLIIATFQCG